MVDSHKEGEAAVQDWIQVSKLPSFMEYVTQAKLF